MVFNAPLVMDNYGFVYQRDMNDKSNEKYNDCICAYYGADTKCIRIR